MIERLKRFLRPRWRVAHFMDRYRDTCWADLCGWAQNADEHGWFDVWYLRGTAGGCARRGETAYCNKCNHTGLQEELGGPLDWDERR